MPVPLFLGKNTDMRSLNQTVTTITLAATATLGVWSGSAKAASLTIGQNFTCATVLDVARLNNGLPFTPPDTIGAVGTDQDNCHAPTTTK
jgi:hypothetical protein